MNEDTTVESRKKAAPNKLNIKLMCMYKYVAT